MQRGINQFARRPKKIKGTKWHFTFMRKAQLATLTLLDYEGEVLASYSWWSYRHPSEEFLYRETVSMSQTIDEALTQARVIQP